MYKLTNEEIQQVKKYIEDNLTEAEKYSVDVNKLSSDKCYLVVNDLTPIEVLEYILFKNIKCLIQNSIQQVFSKINILRTIEKNKSLFFDSTISFVEGDIMIQKFTSHDDRSMILENFFLFNNLDLETVKNQNLYQVTQELVMNAQIDAPKYAATESDKVSSVIIEKNESHNLVAISVIDEYGSLNINKMLDKIYKAHQQGFRESMTEIGHGAGLGSAMLYNFVDSLFIGCIPGQKTRVTAIMPLGLSEKKIEQIQKSICIIEV